MGLYKNFKIASYAHAQYLVSAAEEDIVRQIDYFDAYLGGLDKIYLEPFRGEHRLSEEKAKRFIEIFKERGIEVAGGFTATTDLDDETVHRIFDVYCYSRDNFREELKKEIRQTAKLFDEFILDDFFFTSCRCKECIRKKGNRSWSEYRLELMEEIAHLVCDTAKEVNPDCKCVIKYPNWFESWQETGYNPEKQKDIFDAIYTAAESRNPKMSQQHLPRYLSYSLFRYLENAAPGKNNGAWVDNGDSSNNINWYAEQVLLAVYAGAKEICLFGFGGLTDSPYLPMLGCQLRLADEDRSRMGKPQGVSVYHPFNADCGEDQLYNYVGMLGIPLEPTPFFDEKADSIFLTASACKDPQVMDKLKNYVADGGHAIVTSGFVKNMQGRGIEDMTSARVTEKVVTGDYFCTDPYIGDRREFFHGPAAITMHGMDYKTNATWSDAEMITEYCNYPVWLRDDYGQGELYIWNIPDNYSDLYQFPVEVAYLFRKNFAKNQRVYLEAEDHYNLFLYDNDTFLVRSYREYREYIKIVVKGECSRLADLRSGKTYEPVSVKDQPDQRFDVAYVPKGAKESVFEIYFSPGTEQFLQILP